MNNGSQPLTNPTPGPIIGLAPFVNETELLERCGSLGWVKALDTLLGMLYLVVSLVGISENVYVFWQMFQTMKFRINQVRLTTWLQLGYNLITT